MDRIATKEELKGGEARLYFVDARRWFWFNEPSEADSPPSQFLERSRKDTHPIQELNKVKRRMGRREA